MGKPVTGTEYRMISFTEKSETDTQTDILSPGCYTAGVLSRRAILCRSIEFEDIKVCIGIETEMREM